MVARSRMGGPWSRAQRVARAFRDGGHEVTLAWGDDGNCADPIAPTLDIPVPSPLGLPEAIARHTFPLAARLGLMGRKPVHSFEEVLWLTGALDERYTRAAIDTLRSHMRASRPDVVYSEFSLAAVIAARAEGIPCVGSASQPTTAVYASNPRKSTGIRRLLREMGMPAPASSLTVLEGIRRRFIPSCPTLEPRAGERAVYCGFLDEPPALPATPRDCALVYLGAGSVPAGVAVRAGRELARALGCDVYVAGAPEATQVSGGHTVRCAPRFDFADLLPRAQVFVHHGGQNSMMDALSYEVPQVIVPGRVFERQFNAEAVENARCGLTVREPKPALIARAARRLVDEPALTSGIRGLREELSSLGGTKRIVREVEELVG
ncbi:glycosyl transferase family 1 [Schaalia odontolytica]|uniref:Glycosyl transferase family 1 n=1 Tax=Schaalia odontolytica TaxID=1660 RepID=A0A0V8RT66_9ACTO|nr:nucleotide disphospho-sugar-binding domain-containing protein [Schaalia odontolytica]KSW11265.1 glycosyl transferase family 1 [Schaalia odontolytica]QCT36430.1 glycosyl transferase family 1 [Schaalia odontolytica]